MKMPRTIVAGFLFCAMMLSASVIQGKQPGKAAHAKHAVLILRDSSALETTVSRMVGDSLTKSGYSVKIASLSDIGREKASLYAYSIVFSAITVGDEVDPVIEKFIKTKPENSSSKVILYTVYGNAYDKQKKEVDATTAATETLHPQLIVDHILRSLK
jgi:hypothetical protein